MRLSVQALEGLPEVADGDDLGELIASRCDLMDGDIVVVAQKVISKAEGRLVDARSVEVGDRARELAATTGKDPALVQLILDESKEVLRATRGVLIVETKHGFVCANAGIDSSNVPVGDYLLLPEDPDASARALRHSLTQRSGATVAVVITDSFGRAWRIGQLDVAIGCAGICAVEDLRGSPDADGRELVATIQAVADEVAAAANLAREKSSRQAVVILRGRPDFVTEADGIGAGAALRDRAEDLFR